MQGNKSRRIINRLLVITLALGQVGGMAASSTVRADDDNAANQFYPDADKKCREKFPNTDAAKAQNQQNSDAEIQAAGESDTGGVNGGETAASKAGASASKGEKNKAALQGVDAGYSACMNDEWNKHAANFGNAKGACSTGSYSDSGDGSSQGQYGYCSCPSDSKEAKAVANHRKVTAANRDKINPEKCDPNDPNDKDKSKYKACKQSRTQSADNKCRGVSEKAKQVAQAAQEKSEKASSGMNMQALAQMAAAAGSLLSALMAQKSSDQAAQAAQQLAAAPSGGAPVFTPTLGDPLSTNGALGALTPTTITGSGATATQQAATDSVTTAPSGDLGAPIPGALATNSPLKDYGSSIPAPADKGAGAGGGGGAGVGNVGTQAAGADKGSEPGAPQAATNGKDGGYEGGMSAAQRGGGDPNKGGADLSGMLAQFLPKQGEDSKNGGIVEEYGSRSPASKYMGSESELSSTVNIFNRVNDRYTAVQKKNRVGL